MSWLEFAPIVLGAALLVAVPGGLVGFLIGIRGLWLTAVAAPISISIIAVASVVAPWFGLRWGLIPVGLLTLLAAVTALAWWRWVGGTRLLAKPPRSGRILATVLAIGLGGVLIAQLLIRSIGDPGFISQRYDNFFHLNAVQYVLDTGNASPFWVGSMTSPGGLPFYPSAWHALVSLIVTTFGASPAIATNAAILLVAAIVWPAGAVLLSRTLLGYSPVILVGSGVLAAAFPAYPYLPLHYGVLYPLFLGLACVPVVLAVSNRLLRPGGGQGHTWRDFALLTVLLVPGVAISHPGALLAFLALSFPLFVGRAVIGIRDASTAAARWLWGLGLVGYFAVGLIVLHVIRPPASQIYWPVLGSLPQAIGEIVSAAPYQYPWAPFIAALAAVGAFAVVRKPSYNRVLVLTTALIGALLYVVVAGSTSENLRLWLTAPWYNNAPRLASIWVIGVLPLVVLGLRTAIGFLLDLRWAKPAGGWAKKHPNWAALILAVGLMFAVQGEALAQAAADVEYTYKLRDGGPILTPDEYELMLDIRDQVPDDAVIAGNPWTGASFAYALSGHRVLMPHLLMDETPAAHVINTLLDSEGNSPEVCRALRETGVRYVLDFGDLQFMEGQGDYSGLDDIAQSEWVEPVAERGAARLFRITSCGL